MKIYCSCCAKQVVNRSVDINDQYCTIAEGSKSSGRVNEVICGFCAKDLDENGSFPEEKSNF